MSRSFVFLSHSYYNISNVSHIFLIISRMCSQYKIASGQSLAFSVYVNNAEKRFFDINKTVAKRYEQNLDK